MKRASDRASISPRAVVSFTRIGMLTPATTSAPVSRATAMLRLVGVSPSMSVTMIAPSPQSTPRTALAMRERISSGPSSYEVATLARPSSGPRTSSSVRTISSARRPCPTTTIPTMGKCLLPRTFPGKQKLPLHVPVADEDAMAALLEPPPQLLDEHDRAVAAARAAEGDGEVALALALVVGEGEGEQVEQAAEELLALRAAEHPGGHRGIRARLRAQLLDEERVRQEAAVERQVRIARQAVLVAERDQRDGHRARLGTRDEVAQRAAQLVHGERAGVEDAVGELAQRPELLALVADAVRDATAGRRRVRPPRLAEAPHEDVVARFEVEHLERHPAQLFLRALPQLDEARDQGHRQVVDAVEAQVLEHLDGGALAGAREAGDDDEAGGHMTLGARPVLARCAGSAPPMPPIQRPRGSRRAQHDASRRRPPPFL